MAVSKKVIRVCVLGRRDEFHAPEYPGKACESRMHGHMNHIGAQFLVDQGQAEWIHTERETAKGKRLVPKQENAIRLVPRRTWKGKMSIDGARSMKVMQLVP